MSPLGVSRDRALAADGTTGVLIVSSSGRMVERKESQHSSEMQKTMRKARESTRDEPKMERLARR